MNAGSLYTSIQNNIATVIFSHPASNSFTSDLLSRLTKVFKELSTHDEVHIIVLESENEKTFCAGASLTEFTAITSAEEGKKFFMGFANVINAMRTCSKLIIGRVQGKTVGGGVGLAAACDYCFATEKASIKLSELTLGIGPFVIAPALIRKIGVAAFSELSLNATSWKNAYWAKEKGLYASVFETIREMDVEIEHLALTLSKYNPEALAEMKKIVWENTDHWDALLEKRAEISGNLVLSDATKKALSKFK